MTRFNNKVVWITGASSGIGEALAYAFSREGASIVISARRQAELDRVAANCAAPDKVLVLPLDLADLDSFSQKSDVVLHRFGRIDILVNNGGISQRGAVSETLLAVDQAIMQTNYFGTIALTKAVLPSMLAHQSGSIVVVSSLMGYLDTPLRSAYAASKHALHGYFDSLRAEIQKLGIKVVMICPGYIRTEISLNALNPAGEKHARMDRSQAKGMSAERCAAKILDAVARGRREAFIGGLEVLAVYLKRLMPGLYARIVSRLA
jgi:dehydrogenase/reductase SDR family member 7B